jgi:hypothetical protein
MNNSRALTFLVSGGSIFWILASLAPELAIFGALLLESRPELASEQYFSEWRRAPKISLAPCFHVCENQERTVIIFTSSFSESPVQSRRHVVMIVPAQTCSNHLSLTLNCVIWCDYLSRTDFPCRYDSLFN